MNTLADIAVLIVALLHLSFLVLEMFLWNTPHGHKILGLKPEFAANTRKLAANQGLYNGFLSAGLIWSLFKKTDAFSLKVFFLSCVVIAGVLGALTAKMSILYIQGVPAMIALGLILITDHR